MTLAQQYSKFTDKIIHSQRIDIVIWIVKFDIKTVRIDFLKENV